MWMTFREFFGEIDICKIEKDVLLNYLIIHLLVNEIKISKMETDLMEIKYIRKFYEE